MTNNYLNIKSFNVVSKSAKMKKIYDLVDVVAGITVSIHITGEDGCGKDRLAEYIHLHSGRTGKFIIINPVELNERIGEYGFNIVYDYFLKAENGTIYISDIASATPKLQEYLHNAIIKIEQEKGVNSPRFISATNRNLTELSRQHRFSQRLRDSFAIIINIPPLRERRDDIEDLIDILLKENNKTNSQVTISQDAYDTLLAYEWPGNVRQLANALFHAINHAANGLITVSSLPKEVRRKQGVASTKGTTIDELYKFAKGLLESGTHSDQIDPYFEYLKAVETPLIKAAMDITKGNKSMAAKLIKINRNTLHKKLKDYNID